MQCPHAYTRLTRDTSITKKPFWKPFTRHARLRHKVVHLGARVGQAQAQESLTVATFSLLTSAATAFAADGWVLWRHYVPVNTPEIDDSLMLANEMACLQRMQTGAIQASIVKSASGLNGGPRLR
jgi:hypothetical protein